MRSSSSWDFGDLLGEAVARRAHFELESGHHGELWLDLELLCLHPERIEPAAVQLAGRLTSLDVDFVCGPLNEGAFLGLLIAKHLGVGFSYAERIESSDRSRLFPVSYVIPKPLRSRLSGRRVAIVNDVISAGSAVRGAYADLLACGATPVALACLLVLGDAAAHFAASHNLDLITLEQRAYHVWEPSACPLCSDDVPLERP